MKVGDRVRTIDGKEGVIDRRDEGNTLWVSYGGTGRLYLPWQLTPIVELPWRRIKIRFSPGSAKEESDGTYTQAAEIQMEDER